MRRLLSFPVLIFVLCSLIGCASQRAASRAAVQIPELYASPYHHGNRRLTHTRYKLGNCKTGFNISAHRI